MARFFKVFFLTLFISCLIIFGGIFTYFKFFNPLDNITEYESKNPEFNDNNDGLENDPNATPLDKAIKKSKRINVLVVGLEDTRTDTIMLASYDRKNKVGEIISIPRDTYYEREGYYSGGLKINAVYQSEDIDGLIDAVENVVGIPIHKYVTVDYEAVIKGVNALGGVEVDVPFPMKYSDPYDNPPLYINIPEGRQLLMGEDALGFLRYRKGYSEGDIGRIKAQQQFVKEAVKKLLSFKLPTVIREVYPYIETNFSLSELIALAGDGVGFDMNNLNTYILPSIGKNINGLSFVIPNNEETLQLVYKMYGLIDETESTKE